MPLELVDDGSRLPVNFVQKEPKGDRVIRKCWEKNRPNSLIYSP